MWIRNPDPSFESRFPTLQADSLPSPSEPPGKPCQAYSYQIRKEHWTTGDIFTHYTWTANTLITMTKLEDVKKWRKTASPDSFTTRKSHQEKMFIHQFTCSFTQQLFIEWLTSAVFSFEVGLEIQQITRVIWTLAS